MIECSRPQLESCNTLANENKEGRKDRLALRGFFFPISCITEHTKDGVNTTTYAGVSIILMNAFFRALALLRNFILRTTSIAALFIEDLSLFGRDISAQ